MEVPPGFGVRRRCGAFRQEDRNSRGFQVAMLVISEQSGAGAPHSKTLSRSPCAPDFRQVLKGARFPIRAIREIRG